MNTINIYVAHSGFSNVPDRVLPQNPALKMPVDYGDINYTVFECELPEGFTVRDSLDYGQIIKDGFGKIYDAFILTRVDRCPARIVLMESNNTQAKPIKLKVLD